MRQPIGFFTWAYNESKRLGIQPAGWSLGLSIVLDGAVIAILALSIVELVGYCAL
jgi:hypothetical protein